MASTHLFLCRNSHQLASKSVLEKNRGQFSFAVEQPTRSAALELRSIRYLDYGGYLLDLVHSNKIAG